MKPITSSLHGIARRMPTCSGSVCAGVATASSTFTCASTASFHRAKMFSSHCCSLPARRCSASNLPRVLTPESAQMNTVHTCRRSGSAAVASPLLLSSRLACPGTCRCALSVHAVSGRHSLLDTNGTGTDPPCVPVHACSVRTARHRLAGTAIYTTDNSSTESTAPAVMAADGSARCLAFGSSRMTNTGACDPACPVDARGLSILVTH